MKGGSIVYNLAVGIILGHPIDRLDLKRITRRV